MVDRRRRRSINVDERKRNQRGEQVVGRQHSSETKSGRDDQLGQTGKDRKTVRDKGDGRSYLGPIFAISLSWEDPCEVAWA